MSLTNTNQPFALEFDRRSFERAELHYRDRAERVSEEIWFLAASPQMLHIREEILRFAPVDVPVLIYGETGVGKEVIARMLHAESARSSQPFVKVNCAALPADLLESELFGFEQGAFTGALRSKPGKFELADKGTIFLDEIAEMSPHLQAKLLHVLQDNQYSRLGGRAMIGVDVRVLAATNVDVLEAVKTGRLRNDLYYRLNVLSIHVPPLRERAPDIPLLFRYFVDKYGAKFNKEMAAPPDGLLEAALLYPWPGNLRELENFVKRHVIFEDGERSLQELLEMAEARQPMAQQEETTTPRREGLKTQVRSLRDKAERDAISRALERTHWRRSEAAKLLGISYKGLLNKIRQYGLDARPPRPVAAD